MAWKNLLTDLLEIFYPFLFILIIALLFFLYFVVIPFLFVRAKEVVFRSYDNIILKKKIDEIQEEIKTMDNKGEFERLAFISDKLKKEVISGNQAKDESPISTHTCKEVYKALTNNK